jgi:hypothetical protein
MAYTIGGLLVEARVLLQDVVPMIGAETRFSDTELVDAFNDALLQARAKRPDAFLDMGLRNAVPKYSMPDDTATTFPLDPGYYPALLFYVVGRSELREDTFVEDGRATVMCNKFVSQLLQVAS